jgi:hypothetical protein
MNFHWIIPFSVSLIDCKKSFCHHKGLIQSIFGMKSSQKSLSTTLIFDFEPVNLPTERQNYDSFMHNYFI